jgi:hypothetical protein
VYIIKIICLLIYLRIRYHNLSSHIYPHSYLNYLLFINFITYYLFILSSYQFLCPLFISFQLLYIPYSIISFLLIYISHHRHYSLPFYSSQISTLPIIPTYIIPYNILPSYFLHIHSIISFLYFKSQIISPSYFLFFLSPNLYSLSS